MRERNFFPVVCEEELICPRRCFCIPFAVTASDTSSNLGLKFIQGGDTISDGPFYKQLLPERERIPKASLSNQWQRFFTRDLLQLFTLRPSDVCRLRRLWVMSKSLGARIGLKTVLAALRGVAHEFYTSHKLG